MYDVLHVQRACDYARHSNQQMVIVQLDFKKAYDHVNCSFLLGVKYNIGFGPCICQLIFLLGQNATSCDA